MEKGRGRMESICTREYQRRCSERFNIVVRVEYMKKREWIWEVRKLETFTPEATREYVGSGLGE